ncbi:sulfotransferase domain-containing protein [Acetobacter peroxydans]|jgi:hypothetical protein|uniref:sulfotransferase domain-containing protein n=1 Tax=Acetobacter peroxydans TaxID=104098 RepID=UPI0023540708|nr:sulfotransferase domain-containing protein [Acetobacter peroxydans]MCH4143471.1 sulfotransferase domain-containing protein [Acetobacter peroxydans]MCI1411934.1 sulfotransferase domain-containing protein [Acetobacter peroxydans]MCI1567417.1 sulfotransferase domain-containing protein [Acetobacter peroxydans]MCI1725289.1 sulfotransferase domain-containing protein [Acetobacter peroxydans]
MLEINRTVYSFGSPEYGEYGKMVMLPDGSIYGHVNDRECRWNLDGDVLFITNANNEITSRYKYNGSVFLGEVEGEKHPLYLVPVIATSDFDTVSAPKIFVNSIPKSGTYFVEAALTQAGCPSHRLHVSGYDIVDDYRGLPDQDIHKFPDRCRLTCPLEYLSATISGGHFVGHVEIESVIENISKQNITVVNVIRNLKDVMKSLFRFQTYKVPPNDYDLMGKYWRSLSPDLQKVGFIMHAHSPAFEHISEIAKMILRIKDDAIVLRYEDLIHGEISTKFDTAFQKYDGFNDEFKKQLLALHGSSTPTFIPKKQDDDDIWCDAFEKYFEISGMKSLNEALGY